MRFRPSVLGLVMILAVDASFAPGSSATTIHVNVAGGADYTTIGEGLAAAGAGDTVLVAAGTYSGANNRPLSFGGVNKVLISELGADATIIDGEGTTVVISLDAGEDSTSVVRGFTITHGRGGNGAGMIVYQSSPRIVDCTFRDNVAEYNGGGLWVGYSTAPVIVSGCTFINNSAMYRAGGLMADHSTVTIAGCVFHGNTVSTPEVYVNYGGGGILANSAPVLVTGCTVAKNSAASGAGGILSYAGFLTIEKTIVAFSTQGPGITGWDAVSNSVIFGNAGGDTLGAGASNVLYVDPLFCEAALGNYTLCADSPCLPGSAANPTGQLIGALGEGCAACGTPVVRATWGGIKALFR